eukprot:jgi/Picre1/31425/NNA_006777.t1
MEENKKSQEKKTTRVLASVLASGSIMRVPKIKKVFNGVVVNCEFYSGSALCIAEKGVDDDKYFSFECRSFMGMSRHLAFLKGLQVFGKGQWKQISRYYVPTRTPTQVASHAQKHFLRLSGNTKRRSKFTVVEQNAIASGISLFNGASGSGECQGEGERCGGSGSVSDTKKDVSEYMHGDGGLSKRVKIEDSSQQYQVLRPRVAIPPIDSNGMALGIPLPEIPELKSYDERKAIPMLKVLPGRIKPCTVFKPSSPSPSQKQTKSSESCERKTSRYHRPTRIEGMHCV